MTDITKAKECLKWQVPTLAATGGVEIIWNADRTNCFGLSDSEALQIHIEGFLCSRLFIQVNRGTTSLFKWSVIVGPQNLLGGPAMFEVGRGDSDDLYDAIFDACVQAARLFPNAAGSDAT